MAMNERDMTRLGIMELLVAGMSTPAGTYDHKSIVELVRVLLRLHSWVIREELLVQIENDPRGLTRQLITSTRAHTTKERLKFTALCQEYALFMATAGEMFKNASTAH
jgi:hypothetical protein